MRGPSVALVVSSLLVAACAEHSAPTRPLGSSGTQVASDLLDLPYVPTCGFENGAPCAVPLLERDPPPCDRGLELDNNGTPLRASDDRCRNSLRHYVGADFRGSWADWALANQRTLAIDEPINWVMLIKTHNATNDWADGEIANPNQAWSISDQLDLGSRVLALDLHWVAGAVRMCHAMAVGDDVEVHLGCTARDRLFGYALKEIATWMDAHPREIVVLDIEHHVEGHDQAVIAPLQAFLGDRIFGVSERDTAYRWPSRRELESAGRSVIVGSVGGDGKHNFGDLTHSEQFTLLGLNWGDIENFSVNREDGIITSCNSHSDAGSVDDLQSYDNFFRPVGEDRAFKKSGPFVNSGEVAEIVACNLIVNVDHLWGRHAPLEWTSVHPRPDADRQAFAVWSWREGDRGDGGDAAMLVGASGRWRSAPLSEHHRFACAPVRSETRPRGRGTDDWPSRKGEKWRVTQRAGPWQEGGRACLEEYGDSGMVFSVPVDGHMNGRLRLADAHRGDLWLNYNDIDTEGEWVINHRPTADAGADQTVECEGHDGTLVQLDGANSSDVEGQALSYEWQGAFGTASGAHPTVALPMGRNVVRLVVDDGHAGVSTDEVVIEVVDTRPPEIHAAVVTPAELWPPDHKMRESRVTVEVSDLCDANPTCRIVAVSSNEPVNSSGDGNTAEDWQIIAPLTVMLRAERAGGGAGRVYTLTVECTDAAGNASRKEARVTVPPDRSGKSG
jgi:hypothetical protein